MAERNGQAWFQQFREDHANTVLKVSNFADLHEQSADDKSAFLDAVFTACYSALMFDGNKEHHKQRRRDKLFLEERDGVVNNLDAVIAFLDWHTKYDTSLLNSAMFALGSSSKKQISILSELKEALTTEVKCFTPPHSHQNGCFLYPSPVNADRTTTAPRMLAVNLIGFFRLYTSGMSNAIRQTGWTMPTTGKPNHALVTELVQAVFTDSENIDSRSAEADFKKNSPGLLIVSWEPWGK